MTQNRPRFRLGDEPLTAHQQVRLLCGCLGRDRRAALGSCTRTLFRSFPILVRLLNLGFLHCVGFIDDLSDPMEHQSRGSVSLRFQIRRGWRTKSARILRARPWPSQERLGGVWQARKRPINERQTHEQRFRALPAQHKTPPSASRGSARGACSRNWRACGRNCLYCTIAARRGRCIERLAAGNYRRERRHYRVPLENDAKKCDGLQKSSTSLSC